MKKILSKSFTFEAAHKLLNTLNKNNENIHGHSFSVEVFFEDIDNNIEKTGFILDLHTFNKKIMKIKVILDHSYLNNISGLENPTLENIGMWIWGKLKKKNKHMCKLIIERKTCNESFQIIK
jgi:6-pyruvoyltetrahydropterin/6-carboxytetrahydropterin synthase